MGETASTASSGLTVYGTLPIAPRIDLSKPYFDQSTYLGRVRHFIQVTSPLNLFVTNKGLEDAKTLISDYNAGKIPANTNPAKLWRAKESKSRKAGC
ncbi:hypothetical protein BG011_008921 [Mortierella polycephala]|uniref:Uncharacterized protein n=1 Tax=Mortierella polycephala TaxID=41804 RepID=A0A9P6PQ75_9FUNG|nr:hypothetical protein BG011_008921 [Mortierella polycephala]